MLAVIHRDLGKGYAICFRESAGKTFLVVKFNSETKEFLFPDCFSGELETEDPEVAKQLQGQK